MKPSGEIIHGRQPSFVDSLWLAAFWPLFLIGAGVGGKILSYYERTGRKITGLIAFSVTSVAFLSVPLVRWAYLCRAFAFPFSAIAVSGFFVFSFLSAALFFLTLPVFIRSSLSDYRQLAIYVFWLFGSGLMFYCLVFLAGRKAPLPTVRVLDWLRLIPVVLLVAYYLIRTLL